MNIDTFYYLVLALVLVLCAIGLLATAGSDDE